MAEHPVEPDPVPAELVAAPDQAALRATQIGSWPGTDMSLAARIALEETPALPVLPELPGRGVHAELIGRALGLLTELTVDLQPSGWRLTSGTARDQRRALALFREDLERFEEAADGYVGPVKIAVAGPWTLAASVELGMGDKALGDRGARRELAESLADGVAGLHAELSRRWPDRPIVWQLDEPLLAAVAGGEIRSASGLDRFRAVDQPELVDTLDVLLTATGTHWWLHSCAAGTPWPVVTRTAAAVYSLDVDLVGTVDWDALGPALDEGRGVALGIAPGFGPVPSADELTTRVLRLWEALGLDAAVLDRAWLTPACGLAGQEPARAVQTLRALRRAAELASEEIC